MTSDMNSMPARGWLLLAAVLGVASLYAALQLETDNRLDRMLEERGEAALTYQRFLDTYGSDEFIVVGFTGKPLFEDAALDAMLAALEALEAAPHVSHVSGIPSIYLDRFGGEDPEALREEMTSTPFYFGLFLNPDESAAGLLIESGILDAPGMREEFVAGIAEAIQPLKDYGFTTYTVGVPVIGATINDLSRVESKRSFALAAVLSLIVLFALLRSGRAAVVVVLCNLLSILLTFGLAGALGRPLNLVTSAIPLILWVLGMANCIHLVTRYQRCRVKGLERRAAAAEAYADVRFPCTVSAITTAFGFLSLLVATVPPVRELGQLMACGILISLGVNLMVGPWLLYALRAGAPRGAKNERQFFGNLAAAVAARPWPIITAFLVLMVAGVYGLKFIKSEPNSLEFLPDDHPTVQAYHFVGENLTGMYGMELLIQTPGGWLNPDYWPALEDLAEEFRQSDLVARVVSPLGFLKKMHQWDTDLAPENYRLPESRAAAEDLFGLVEEEKDRNEIGRLIRADGEEIRLSVLINSTEVERFMVLADEARAKLAALPPPLTGVLTGVVPRMQTMHRGLIQTQIYSFGLAFFLVFTAILVGLRSPLLTVVSVVPNAIPVLAIFALMALLQISLDAGTVMVASMALGIAVDNTVHILAGYRRASQDGLERIPAIRATLLAIGPAVTVTTVTACIGFFVLTTSSFVPIFYFGLLSGSAMIVALGADLLFVPAVLSLGIMRN